MIININCKFQEMGARKIDASESMREDTFIPLPLNIRSCPG